MWQRRQEKDRIGATLLSTLSHEGDSLILTANAAYKACHYVCGFVSYIYLAIDKVGKYKDSCRNSLSQEKFHWWEDAEYLMQNIS